MKPTRMVLIKSTSYKKNIDSNENETFPISKYVNSKEIISKFCYIQLPHRIVFYVKSEIDLMNYVLLRIGNSWQFLTFCY